MSIEELTVKLATEAWICISSSHPTVEQLEEVRDKLIEIIELNK